jgi:phage major head subunit gpT-like protein
MALASHAGRYVDLGSRAIIGNFFRQYEQDLAGTWAMLVSWFNDQANQETETYKMLGAAPSMRKWLGEKLAKEMEVYSYQITNEEFEATLKFKKADRRRDKTPQIETRISGLSMEALDHWNELVTDLITANGTCYDGSNFFSANHQNGSSGVVKNLLVAGDVPALNVVAPSDPTQTEMVKAIIGLVQHAYSIKNEQNKPANGNARQWCLMVPANMIGSAGAAIGSERLDNGQSNLLKSQFFAVEAIPNPRLAAANELYLFRKDSPIKPFILQEEVAPQVKVLGEGSDHEFKHNEHLFSVESTRNAGYGEFMYGFKGTFS